MRREEIITTLPSIGAFLRPIGMTHYGYCFRVMQQFYPEQDKNLEFPAIEYERWGILDGCPFDDGHVRRGYFIDLVPTLIPEVWRYPPLQPDAGCRDGYRYSTPSYQIWETYYRLIGADEHGQRELFA